VHTFERDGLPGIHFENYALGLIDPCFVVSDRRTGYEPPVFQNRRDLNQRHIQLPEESIFDELGNMAEMDVHIVHFAGVDALACLGIRLIGKAQVNASRHGESAIEFRPGRRASENADLKFLTAKICFRYTTREFDRYGFRIA